MARMRARIAFLVLSAVAAAVTDVGAQAPRAAGGADTLRLEVGAPEVDGRDRKSVV